MVCGTEGPVYSKCHVYDDASDVGFIENNVTKSVTKATNSKATLVCKDCIASIIAALTLALDVNWPKHQIFSP